MSVKQHLREAFPGRPEEMPSLDGATGWLNSEALRTDALRGSVVVVEFWTYSCINWLRTLPYVRAWSENYRAEGLVTIGVHSPEFSFEHDVENIRRAARDMNIEYPIAIDSDFAIWRAFGNQYWPALYFVDAQGRIRHHHFGEGEYVPSERMIQQLLAESGRAGVDHDPVPVAGIGAEAAADWDSLRSPESYLGYQRAESFASPGGSVSNVAAEYTVPDELRLNRWALSGNWTIRGEAAVLNAAGGKITYRFEARDLHLVMGATTPDATVRFRVLVDGLPPGAAHGVDVDDEGNGVVREPRLYQLVRQPGRIRERTFEITFLDPGLQGYVFTFG